jgi:hypothetical protein
MESRTPIGFLQGGGGISEEIQTLMSLAHPLPSGSMVTFSDDSDELIKELTDFLDLEYTKYHELYK